MNNDIFEKYSVPKAVFALATPTVMSMLVNIIYNMADTFFVGQTGDKFQVAAVSLTAPIFMLIMAFGNIFGIGGSAFISRLLGQKRDEDTKHVSSFCFWSAVGFGLIIMSLLILFRPFVLNMLGTSVDTYQFTYDYYSYYVYGTIFSMISITLGNIVRAEGNAKGAMRGMMLGSIVNIILDPIMILYMDLGVAGAAIATVIGNICSSITFIYLLTSSKTSLSIKPSDYRFNKEIVYEVFTIGLPASINNLLISFANVTLNNYLHIYGDDAITAMGVAMKAHMLVTLVQIGLSAGCTPLFGYCFGAKNYERLHKSIRFAILCNFVFGLTVSLTQFIFASDIVKVFIDNPDVISLGVIILRIYSLTGPFIGILFVFTNTFQAMGKPIPSLILSLSRQGLIFLPALIILNAIFKLNGVICAQVVADIFSIVAATVMYRILMSKQEKIAYIK